MNPIVQLSLANEVVLQGTNNLLLFFPLKFNSIHSLQAVKQAYGVGGGSYDHLCEMRTEKFGNKASITTTYMTNSSLSSVDKFSLGAQRRGTKLHVPDTHSGTSSRYYRLH